MTGAILLAGGRASRVGGADKTLFALAGTTLLQRAVDAVAGADPITVVGDPVPGVAGVAWAREDPPFGGPAAAAVAALATWSEDPEWTYLLACDLPEAVAAASGVSARASPGRPARTKASASKSCTGPNWSGFNFPASMARRNFTIATSGSLSRKAAAACWYSGSLATGEAGTACATTPPAPHRPAKIRAAVGSLSIG